MEKDIFIRTLVVCLVKLPHDFYDCVSQKFNAGFSVFEKKLGYSLCLLIQHASQQNKSCM